MVCIYVEGVAYDYDSAYDCYAPHPKSPNPEIKGLLWRSRCIYVFGLDLSVRLEGAQGNINRSDGGSPCGPWDGVMCFFCIFP